MGEHLSKELENAAREQIKRDYIIQARELAESHEIFPFPGINPEAYSRLKAADKEYAGYSTPTDEIIEKLRAQGVKVAFSDEGPGRDTVFILPANNTNNWEDSLFPRYLAVTDNMDPRLKKLILKSLEHNQGKI